MALWVFMLSLVAVVFAVLLLVYMEWASVVCGVLDLDLSRGSIVLQSACGLRIRRPSFEKENTRWVYPPPS